MLKHTFLLFALALAPFVMADNQSPSRSIQFSVMTIPVYIEENKTGPMYELHQQMLNTLAARTKLKFETHITPPLRAQQNFISARAQALMPDFCDSNLGTPEVHSVPFARVIRHILTPPGSASIDNYAALKDKKVGLVRGYSYEIEGEIGKDIELIWTTNQRQTLRMLNSGRLDAIVANVDEITQIVRTGNTAMPSVNLESPVLDRALCYVFHDTPLGRYLALELSAEIIALKRNGALAKTLGGNHIPDFHPANPEVR